MSDKEEIVQEMHDAICMINDEIKKALNAGLKVEVDVLHPSTYTGNVPVVTVRLSKSEQLYPR